MANNSVRRKKNKKTSAEDVVEGSFKRSGSMKSMKKKKKKKNQTQQTEDNRTVMQSPSVKIDVSNKKNKKRKKGTARVKAKTSTPNATPDAPAKFDLVVDKANFVTSFSSMGVNDLKKEFKNLQDASKAETINAHTSNANMQDNRYKNIHCLEATRVRLPGNPTFYYNANVVGKRFIFAQSPTPSTIEKFWDVIAYEEVDSIIQLTSFDEKKCAPYFGPLGQSIHYGGYTVTASKHDIPVESPSDPPLNLVVHLIKYRAPSSDTTVTLKNYFWKDWPAGSVPDVSNTIPYLYLMTKNDKKVLIHCSSGSGRTAVVGMSIKMLGSALNGDNVNLLSNTEEFRKKRHMSIRNVLQYLFVGRNLIAFFMKHNACDMSQSLLEFIDEYDSFARKYKKEDEEARRSRNLPGPEELSELSNEPV